MFFGHSMPESEQDSVHLPTSVASQFHQLQTMLNEECSTDPDNLTHCSTALEGLRDIYRHVRYFALVDDVDMGRIWRWVVFVPTEYVQLLKARYPPALVILAYFSAINAMAQSEWFVEQFSAFSMQSLTMELDEMMQKWLEWPRQQMEVGFAALRDNSVIS